MLFNGELLDPYSDVTKQKSVKDLILIRLDELRNVLITEFESEEKYTRHCRTRVYFQWISLRGNWLHVNFGCINIFLECGEIYM